MRSFYEFFAGGGMVRAGLGPGWRCLLANDIDPAKAQAYAARWGRDALRVADVAALAPADLPGRPDLVWASFPCQDLSLAGGGAGLGGERSGAFWPFWRLVRGMAAEGRAPAVVALENVCGALSAQGGRAFAALCGAFAEAGYAVGALVIDASAFVPQSRPRLFIVGRRDGDAPALSLPGPLAPFHTPALIRAVAALPPPAAAAWRWWRLTPPRTTPPPLAALIEDAPADVRWHAPTETARLEALMAPPSRERLDAALADGGRHVGCVYRRTRPDGQGGRAQRAELRMDGLAGCLRTPAGGSSRQIVMIVADGRARSRLMSGREMARLMGLPDSHPLPARHAAACHLLGDGVVAPVVAHLARGLIEPLLAETGARAPLRRAPAR